jgi:hypothetical protein
MGVRAEPTGRALGQLLTDQCMNRSRGTLLRVTPLLAFALLAGAPACQHDTTTVFSPGLEPLGTDTVAPPNADGGDAYPETLVLTQGTQGDLGGSGYNYVVATGYVQAGINDVWAAFKIPNVVVDRHAINSYTVQNNVEKGYDVSFATDYTINNVITVSYTLTWREGAVAGTEGDPSQVSVVYEKTFGSSFVSIMAGSIELISVNAGVTELQFVQHMNATDTDSGTIASWTNELFASVVAQVHGKSLP